MTKRLDPEIKALRAVDRAVKTVPPEARQRVLEWLVARECSLPDYRLPPVVPSSGRRWAERRIRNFSRSVPIERNE